MRYKDYVWPHNPRTYTIDYERRMAAQKVPFGRYHLQDLGLTRRVMKGEGEFVGPTAYEEFKKLASVFYQSGPGPLIHPVWQAAEVYFVELSLRQEPRPTPPSGGRRLSPPAAEERPAAAAPDGPTR